VTIGLSCFAGDRGRSGIGAYLISLLREIPGLLAPDERVEVVLARGEARVFVPADPSEVAIEVSRILAHPVLNVAWHWTSLPVLAARRSWDVLFLPAANRRLPIRAGCPTVGTVHDLASLHVPQKYDPARTFYITRVLPRLIRRLTRILVPSESTRMDVIRAAGVPRERIEVIPLGVDQARFSPRDRDAARRRVIQKVGLRPPWVLYVSRIEHPGKNHVRLIEAFERLRARMDARLLLVGADWTGAEEVHRRAARSRAAHDIVFAGFMDPADLPDLYAASDAVVFPSLYEGFGLPVLEAMACGAAVACANRSSLPEVAGDAAILFDPTDIEQMASAMERLIGDPAVREDLSARGTLRSREFTWRRTAERTLAAIRSVANSGRTG